MRGSLRREDLPLMLGAAGLLVAAVVHLRAWVFVCDDAYISFRYARNLVEHGALAFNIVEPPELIEGYTNFLWVMVMAGGAAVGVPPETLAPWLTQVAEVLRNKRQSGSTDRCNSWFRNAYRSTWR